MGGGRSGLWVLAVVVGLAGCADRAQPASADGQLMVLPKGLDFGPVALFDSRELKVSLRNVGRGRINVKDLAVEGPDGKYEASFARKNGAGFLISGEGAEVKVSFSPGAAGPQETFLAIHTDSLERVIRVPLRGMGVDARAAIDARVLDFGRIEAQLRKVRQLTFRNISDLPVVVASRTLGPDSDEFDVPSISLAPREERKVDVVFHPSRVGRKQASLGITPCLGCAEVPVLLVAEALDRAVVAEPWAIDFGQAPVDASVARTVLLHNLSTEPMVVTSMGFSRATDPSFSAAAASFPVTLGPDERRGFDLGFGVSHEGSASGEVDFGVQSVRNPTTVVPLQGFGGAAEVSVSPLSFDFGSVPVGGRVPTEVVIRNSGAEFPLVVQEVSFGGDNVAGEDEFHLAPIAVPQTLNPGEKMTVKIFFEPLREGVANGFLHLKTNGFSAASLRVGFGGQGVVYPGCSMKVTPVALDFGTVPPGEGAVLGLRLKNDGTQPCAVKNVRIIDGTDVFSLPGGNIEGWPVQPGESFTFMVAFKAPSAGGTSLGGLQVESADPKNPRFLVPLQANSQDSCLVATPAFLDFGRTRPDCPLPPRSVNLVNQCAQPVALSAARIGAGTADGEFVLGGTSAPLPRVMAPGEGLSVQMSYLGQVEGLNLSPLYLDVGGLLRPLLVPLVGESSLQMDQVDRFVQQDGSKMDVLFVVDNSHSMDDEQPRLITALPAFVDEVLRRGVDAHIAVTTTGIDPVSDACPGGAQGGEAGRLFPVDNSSPRILTQATPNLAGVLQQNANVGLCTWLEEGLEASRRALSTPLVDHAKAPSTSLPNDGNLGFLREDAGLALVFVGDEDDHSPDDVDTYVRFLQATKGVNQPQRVVAYAISPTQQACASAGGTGTRYAEVAQKMGGEVLDICATDYAPLLRDVADKAFSPQTRFPLSASPASGSIQVLMDGVEQSSGWTFDAAQNAVVFASQPATGAHIEIHYRKVCGG